MVDYYTVNIHFLFPNLYDFPAPPLLDSAMWLASANRMWAKMTLGQFQTWAFTGFPCVHLPAPLSWKGQTPGRFCFSRMGSKMRHTEQTWTWPSALLLQVAPEHTQHGTNVSSSRKSHHRYLENCRGGRRGGRKASQAGPWKAMLTSWLHTHKQKTKYFALMCYCGFFHHKSWLIHIWWSVKMYRNHLLLKVNKISLIPPPSKIANKNHSFY